ncbi:Nose resistant to fluoxetine protein 6 [Halotydeus destructor]|nr:Nose resistant to fluoxetine protein 6 [Halotydeus destructor]
MTTTAVSEDNYYPTHKVVPEEEEPNNINNSNIGNSNIDNSNIASYDFILRSTGLALQSFCATACIILSFVIFRLRRDKVIVRYFDPCPSHCLIEPWLRELGFGFAYGSIIIKLYRIMAEFRTRKAHRVCIRDKDLVKYLAGIIVVIIGYLAAWTVLWLDTTDHGDRLLSHDLAGKLVGHLAGSNIVSHLTINGQTYVVCKELSWDYVTEIGEILFLLTGLYITYSIRNARQEVYREKWTLCFCVYIETIISSCLYIVRHLFWSRLHPDYMFLLYLIRCQLTVTIVLIMLIGPKLWKRNESNCHRKNRNISCNESESRNTPGILRLHEAILNAEDVDISDINLSDMDPEEIRTTTVHATNETGETAPEYYDDGQPEAETDYDDHDKHLPYYKEGQSLNKLQKFLLTNVESMIKATMPVILQSGQETNISSSCIQSFFALLSALRENKIWAYRMLDASGKPPSGILEGTLTDLGAFEQCLSVVSDTPGPDQFAGRYCLLDLSANFDHDPPLGMASPPPGIKPDDIVWDGSLQIFWSMNRLLSFRYGACIPSTCTGDDLSQMANYFAQPAGMKANVNSCQMDTPQAPDVVQISIMGTFAAIFFLVILGTSVEYVQMCKVENQGKPAKCHNSQKSLANFLTCFSIHTNTKKLLATTENISGSPLRCLDGIRFFTLAWIILGRARQVRDVDDTLASMPLANFTLSVDTFFFVSGLLLIFASWSKMNKSKGKVNMVDFIIHRVWRIWPPYATTIGLAMILPLLGSGPLWPKAVESTAATCRQSWWTNLLFVNNLLDADQVCLFHTWFLSASMQYHVIGGFLLYAVYRSPTIGIVMSILLTAISSLISFASAYAHNVRVPSVVAFEVFADYEQKILKLYTAPYTHFGSYLSGIIVGYFLVKHRKANIPKSIQAVAWVISFLTMALVNAGPLEAFRSNLPSLVNSSLYYAFARTAWAWAIGWIVFACATGRGGPINQLLSWSAFGPLSALSYLAYLTHPLLMLYHTGRVRERIYFGHYEMWSIFLSRMCMTFVLAYFVHVIIEVPFARIESYVFPKKNVSPPKTKVDNVKF